jgi:hypothetical protein
MGNKTLPGPEFAYNTRVKLGLAASARALAGAARALRVLAGSADSTGAGSPSLRLFILDSVIHRL